MSWYDNLGPQSDIAVSSRIRLARNISGIPFPSVMNEDKLIEVNNLVKNALLNSNTPFAKSLKFIQMKDIPENERFSMVERHIISREFVSNCENKAIIISDDESICIMLGEEDHIRIQVIKAGLDVLSAYDVAEQIDSLLCGALDIAFDKNLGFLTSCPTNLGTGLRASVMLHLPLLKISGDMGVLSEQIGKIGFTVRGMYGEGTKASASLYQISNQITLGITEKNAIDNLKIVNKDNSPNLVDVEYKSAEIDVPDDFEFVPQGLVYNPSENIETDVDLWYLPIIVVAGACAVVLGTVAVGVAIKNRRKRGKADENKSDEDNC